MPTTATPFGLRPVLSESGTIRPEAQSIASAYNTSILQYAPVKIGTNGTIELAAAGERCIGVFMGCSYIDVSGRPIVSNQWVANTAALTGTVIDCWVTREPSIVYEIQSAGSVVQADVGSQADWGTATAGSTTTGLSTMSMSTTMTNSGSAGLRIIGFGTEPNNAIGDTYTNVLVKIAEHQDVADIVAY
jgi:hypothetical protein